MRYRHPRHLICSVCVLFMASLLIPARAEVGDFPSFGVKIKAPRGWERVPPGSQGQIVRWAQLREDGTKAKDVVVFELAKLQPDLSPLAYAKRVAEQYQGEINQEVMLGSLPAVEVRSQRHTDEMTPRQTRVAAHRGHLWILSFWAVGKGGLAKKTISAMAKTVEWQDFADPSEHLALAEAPVTMLNGKLKAKVPDLARPDAVEDPKTSQAVAIRNFGRDLTTFILKVQIPEENQTPDFAAAKARFAAHLGTKFPKLSTLQWEDFDLKGATGAFLAPVVLKEEPGKPTFREYHYALLARKEELIVVSFSISTWSAEGWPKYRSLIKQIVRSIDFPQ